MNPKYIEKDSMILTKEMLLDILSDYARNSECLPSEIVFEVEDLEDNVVFLRDEYYPMLNKKDKDYLNSLGKNSETSF